MTAPLSSSARQTVSGNRSVRGWPSREPASLPIAPLPRRVAGLSERGCYSGPAGILLRSPQAVADARFQALDDLGHDLRRLRLPHAARGLPADVVVHLESGAQLLEPGGIARSAYRRVVLQHALDDARIEDAHVAGDRKAGDLVVDVVDVFRPPGAAQIAVLLGHSRPLLRPAKESGMADDEDRTCGASWLFWTHRQVWGRTSESCAHSTKRPGRAVAFIDDPMHFGVDALGGPLAERLRAAVAFGSAQVRILSRRELHH